MPEDTLDLDKLTDSLVEVFTQEGKNFYSRYGKEVLEEDQELLKELAEATAKYTWKMGLAKLTRDQATVDRYTKSLEFVTATMATRLALRNLQLQAEAKTSLENVLTKLVEMLGGLLPVLLQSLLKK